MTEYKAPTEYPKDDGKLSVFLAGTIDNGESDDWQHNISEQLKDCDVNILNPRRSDWNPDSGIDDLKNQINWELDALEDATLIIMYLAPNSKSPISLMELGLNTGKPMVVCCPDGFWRKTNVDVVCERYQIPVIDDEKLFFQKIVQFIENESKNLGIQKNDGPEEIETDETKKASN